MMKLALIKAKSTTKTTTPRYQFSIVKTTYHIKNAEKVPNFAARWRAICKYFIISENKQPKRRYKIQQQNKVKRHTPILRKKKSSPTKSNPLLFSFQVIRASINTMRSLAAKRIEDALRRIFLSYHHYLMKALN